MQETPGASGGGPQDIRLRESDREHPHEAQDVRQGEVILRTRRRRWIFFGGLVAAVVLAVVVSALF